MASESKDIWDILSALTPLLIGIFVTALGAVFTHLYNSRQLQLNQITSLERMRPLLTSEKPEEREFGYASFVALGYEGMAIRIIKINKDQSGRGVLKELQEAKSPAVKASASLALQELDEASKLLNKLEYGDERGLATWVERGNEQATKLGIETKLGKALIASVVISRGPHRVNKIAAATSKKIGELSSSGVNESGVSEKEWIVEFIEQMKNTGSPIYQNVEKVRVREFKKLIENNDWELTHYSPNHQLHPASFVGE